MTDRLWDVVVVGGGAAGLSAALVLGRARRSTLVIDRGRQSNLPAHGIGGLLGHDGRPPAELYASGRDELRKYSVDVEIGTVVAASGKADDFTLTLDTGDTVRARRIVLAAGMDYTYPDIPGVAELWGRSVFHCPFCHGWEVQDQPLAVLDGGPMAEHRVQLLSNWSDDVVLLTNGEPSEIPGADTRRVARLSVVGGELEGVVFEDGSTLRRKGILVPAPLSQRSDLAEQLGVTFADPSPASLNPVAADTRAMTNVPGVFAAGDIGAPMPQVAAAVATGSMAGNAAVQTLIFGL
ncbi:NAD(P)/FAD-dependent oxidoreductase [Smaragdicoccus niigatensis]|uniref:NAD(P)/FAD-dependent oxidoreductase n=1 Tax=Smaragdicoccus niigatensis TaxID=359359 RepID=UPI0003821599|nr:NAD(P)/FAD-dependent oxidoreductase [Smaragdicoccus niigatensis]